MSRKTKPKQKTNKQNDKAALFDNLAFWVATATAVLLPLTFTTTLYEQWHLPKVALLRTGISVAAGCLAISKAYTTEDTNRWPKSVSALMLLMILAVVSLAFSGDRNASFWGVYGHFEGMLGIAVYAMAFIVGLQAYMSDQRVKILSKGLTAPAAVISVYGIFQFLGIDFFNWGQIPFGNTRIFATFGNPTYLATFLVAALPVVLSLAVDEENGQREDYIFKGALLVLIAGLMLTFTRSAWIAAIVEAVIFAAFLGPRKRPNVELVKLTGAVAAVIVIVLIATMTVGGGDRAIFKRLTDTFNASEGSVGSRVQIYKTSVNIIVDHPILGVGPDQFRFAFAKAKPAQYVIQGLHPSTPDDAHNLVLNIAATLGLPACLALLVFLFWTWTQGLFGYKCSGPAEARKKAWILSSIGVFLALMFTPSEVGGTFWMWFALGVGAASQGQVGHAGKNKAAPALVVASMAVITAILMTASSLTMVAADNKYLRALQSYNSQPDEALAFAASAVKAYPYVDSYHILKGKLALSKCLFLRDDRIFSESINAFEEGIKILPGAYSVQKELGAAYVEGAKVFGGRYFGSAIDVLERSLVQNPKDPEVWTLISEAYAGLGKNADSEYAASQAARLGATN